MAGRIPARLTPAEGRKFAFTVGLAFVALAALGWWRGRQVVPLLLATPGGLLLAAGLLAPTRLGAVQRGWMALGHHISRVTTPIVLAATYYLAIAPVGVVRRLFGRNALHHTDGATGFWTRSSPAAADGMERQF